MMDHKGCQLQDSSAAHGECIPAATDDVRTPWAATPSWSALLDGLPGAWGAIELASCTAHLVRATIRAEVVVAGSILTSSTPRRADRKTSAAILGELVGCGSESGASSQVRWRHVSGPLASADRPWMTHEGRSKPTLEIGLVWVVTHPSTPPAGGPTPAEVLDALVAWEPARRIADAHAASVLARELPKAWAAVDARRVRRALLVDARSLAAKRELTHDLGALRTMALELYRALTKRRPRAGRARAERRDLDRHAAAG